MESTALLICNDPALIEAIHKWLPLDDPQG
jgi:hypothetical protein